MFTIAVIILSIITFLLGLLLERANDVTSQNILSALFYLEGFTACFFFLEYITRLLCTPNLCQFICSLLNFADLVAILPFALSVLMYELETLEVVGKAGKMIHMIRVLKVFRVFKLVRHVANLKSILVTLNQASKELGLLALLAAIAHMTFASLIFYAEKDDLQWTFAESLWWSLLTLTSVG